MLNFALPAHSSARPFPSAAALIACMCNKNDYKLQADRCYLDSDATVCLNTVFPLRSSASFSCCSVSCIKIIVFQNAVPHRLQSGLISHLHRSHDTRKMLSEMCSLSPAADSIFDISRALVASRSLRGFSAAVRLRLFPFGLSVAQAESLCASFIFGWRWPVTTENGARCTGGCCLSLLVLCWCCRCRAAAASLFRSRDIVRLCVHEHPVWLSARHTLLLLLPFAFVLLIYDFSTIFHHRCSCSLYASIA